MNNNVKDFDVATICVPVFFCDDYSPLSLSLIKPITLIQHYAYSNYLVWNKPDTQAYQEKKKNVKFIPFPEGVWNFQKKKTVENDRAGMILSQEPEMVGVKISVSKTS